MTPHIQIIHDKLDAETRQARHDWAAVTGETIKPRPTTLIDTRSGWRYAGIAGALAWPGIEPGCMIIAGYQSVPEPTVTIVDYAEHMSVYDLIDAVVMARTGYAFGQHPTILPYWVGDPERYQSVSVAVSTALEKKRPDSGLYIREPVDWSEKHRFPMYIRQLHDALRTKFLRLNGHSDLINRLQAFQPDQADKGKIDDFPAVGMLGALVHTLMIEKPWQQDIDHGKPIILED